MIPVRHLRARRGEKTAHRRDWLVIDLNEDVCSVWSPVNGVVAEPSRALVGPDGEARAFGFEADLATGDRGSRFNATGLFDLHSPHEHLESAFLAWLLERSGVDPMRGVPVFVSLDPGAASEESNSWCRAVGELGGDVLVIHRPIAAALALGLDVNESSCHFMIEVLDSHIAMAVIRAGSVGEAARVERTDFAAITRFVEESLASLDPDEELEVRDRGVSMYGWSALRYVRETISAIGLPLSGPVGRGPTVLNGARLVADEVLPWLALG